MLAWSMHLVLLGLVRFPTIDLKVRESEFEVLPKITWDWLRCIYSRAKAPATAI